jgi:hypothetical protein
MLPAVLGGLHDGVRILDRHRPARKWHHLPCAYKEKSRIIICVQPERLIKTGCLLFILILIEFTHSMQMAQCSLCMRQKKKKKRRRRSLHLSSQMRIMRTRCKSCRDWAPIVLSKDSCVYIGKCQRADICCTALAAMYLIL